MVGQLQRSSARAARTRRARAPRTAAAQPGRVSSSPMRHPSSLEALLEVMALFGEPAPQTSQRRSDYCSPHGPFPNKTERELARDEERERKRQVEHEIDRTIGEVSLLRERERGRELGAAGPEEEADLETAKLAVQQGTHSGRTRRQGGDGAKGRQGATAAIGIAARRYRAAYAHSLERLAEKRGRDRSGKNVQSSCTVSRSS